MVTLYLDEHRSKGYVVIVAYLLEAIADNNDDDVIKAAEMLRIRALENKTDDKLAVELLKEF